MQFSYTADERELLAYARQSIRGTLPLNRFRTEPADVGAWVALGRDGWLHACLDGDSEALDLPVLAGIAREAGAVAAGPEFVSNAWVLPQLCAHIADVAESASWLTTHLASPGYVSGLQDTLQSIGSVNGQRLELGARPGFVWYEFVDAASPQLGRGRANVAAAPVAGLSIGAGRVELDNAASSRVGLSLTLDARAVINAGISVLRCAALVGSADELLARTVAYVNERQQFGQPLGQFQAVKHLCADLHTELQVSWLSVLYAALCWKHDATALQSARVHATSVALAAARVGAQLHGGMGFTWESDLHWLLKAVLDGQLHTQSASAAAREIGEQVLAAV